MEHTYSLARPELLTITGNGRTWRGANQEWYAEDWQRKAGCGPTTASLLVSYLAQTRPGCKDLYPSGSWEKDDFVGLMDQVWRYVTPGRHGVNRTHIFTKGLREFSKAKGVTLSLRELSIPRFKIARPTVDQCAAFIRAGLEAECPVAWLNLHNGGIKGLDSWHWVSIIALEAHSDGPLLCTYLDSGRERTADFRLWFQATKAGGGLVYLARE